MQDTKNNIYRHYIALDWSKQIVAMATMRDNGGKIQVEMLKPDVKEVKKKLKSFSGSKILTIEETTTSHWLYVEFKDYVEKIIICDPFHNSLLSEGAQTDKTDAKKLCQLLRTGMLKEVYHSLDKDYQIRKLVSGYIDLVKASVRLKNQRSAVFNSGGRNHKKEKVFESTEAQIGCGGDNYQINKFVTERQLEHIVHYKSTIEDYQKEFKKIEKANITVERLIKISGIGLKTAVMIYSTVIDGRRFENKYKYWAYCGLVKKYKESGGIIYRSKKARYSPLLKKCYMTAAMAAVNGNNDIREFYEHLLKEGLSTEKARRQVARYIAKVSYVVMKNKIEYRAYQWRESKDTGS